MLAYCVYVLKVTSIDGLMPFLVACHCTIFILIFCFVMYLANNFFSLSVANYETTTACCRCAVTRRCRWQPSRLALFSNWFDSCRSRHPSHFAVVLWQRCHHSSDTFHSLSGGYILIIIIMIIRSITNYYKISRNDLPPHQQSSREAELHWSVESTCSTAGKESCRLEFHLKLRQFVDQDHREMRQLNS